MLVWILQTGEPLNCDLNQLRPMRAINLSNALISKGHKVEIISTRFFHQEKRFRKNIKIKNINGIKEIINCGLIREQHVYGLVASKIKNNEKYRRHK